MLSTLKPVLVGCALACLLPGALNAASMTASTGPDAQATIFYDFNTTTNTSVGTFSGGVLNGGADPLNVLNNNWIAAADVSNGSFTLTLKNSASYIGFAWGSIDSGTGNTIDVYGAGNALLNTFTGGQFLTSGGSNAGSPPNDYANIFAGSGQVITSLVFSQHNSGCCFETDNFSYIGAPAAVPGPVVGAGLPGLLAGFGALLAWRRKRLAAV